MCYKEKDDEFSYYRDLYIKCISTQKFPWEPAYYYYMQNIDRIDVMSIDDFQDELLTASSLYNDTQEAFKAVSQPIYATLDDYYEVQLLLAKDNKVIKLV